MKQSLDAITQAPNKLLLPLILAFAYQTTMIMGHIVVFNGLGQKLDVLHFFYLIPITAFATLLPISLNGVGLRESAFVVAFAQIGVASEYALALSLIIALFTMGISAIGGILHLIGQTNSTLPYIQNSPSSTS